MILFDEIIEVMVGLMKNIMTKCFADGAWVGVVPVRYDPLWSMTHRFKRLPEKAFRGLHVSFLAQHRVNQVPITINGTIQVTPFPVHFHIRAHRHASRCLLARAAFCVVDPR